MEAGIAQPPAGTGTLGVGHQPALPEAGSAGGPPELRRALGRRRPGLPAPCQAFGGSHLRPQNQALNALVFLYRHVLDKDVGHFDGLVRAKRPKRLPVVLTRAEVRAVLAELEGIHKLVGTLLYGTGMRIMECLRLRVQDVDFERREITVRDGKGKKDRRTMLPDVVVEDLRTHLRGVRKLHQQDLGNGRGRVYLPYALDRKYPNAAAEWRWQYGAAGSRGRQNDGDLHPRAQPGSGCPKESRR